MALGRGQVADKFNFRVGTGGVSGSGVPQVGEAALFKLRPGSESPLDFLKNSLRSVTRIKAENISIKTPTREAEYEVGPFFNEIIGRRAGENLWGGSVRGGADYSFHGHNTAPPLLTPGLRDQEKGPQYINNGIGW